MQDIAGLRNRSLPTRWGLQQQRETNAPRLSCLTFGLMSMVYYTQFIFLKPEQADAFQQFEEHVLPLLAKYNGRMLLRWRRTPACVIETSIGDPDEVHLVAFATVDDFKNYMNDDTRRSFLHLKDRSVQTMLLIEGVQI